MNSVTCYLGVFRLNFDSEAKFDVDQFYSDLGISLLKEERTGPENVVQGNDPSGVLIDNHRSTGARALDDFLVNERAEDIMSLVGAGVEFEIAHGWFGQIRVSHLGVGAVEVWTRSPFDAEFEKECVAPSNALLQRIFGTLEQSGVLGQGRSSFALPANRILWWHRLQIVRDGSADPIIPEGSLDTVLGGTRKLTIGDGFSTLQLAGEQDRLEFEVFGDVIEGIIFAQEDYLILDRSGRELSRYLDITNHISDASRRDLISIEEEGWKLSRLGHSARLYMDERNRFLACNRRQSWALALQAWGIEREISTFQDKIDAIRDLSINVVSALQARQDGARNLVLFSLAIIAALQGALLAFDFSVSDDVTLNHPLRFWSALIVLCASLGVATYFAIRAYANRKRRTKP